VLSPGELMVLNFLLAKGASTSRGCWWRQKRIAEETGISVRSVQRHISKLERAGLLRIQHRQATTNLYFADAVENAQGSFNFCGNRGVPPRQNGGPFYRTEVKATEEQAGPAEFSQAQLEAPRVQAALRRARSRIERADNPRAYARAIIAAELAADQARAAMQQTAHVPAPDWGMTPELEAFIREHEARQRELGILPPANTESDMARNGARDGSPDSNLSGSVLAEEAGVGVEGHARQRRDGTGRCNPAVGLLDGQHPREVCAGRHLIAPTRAGIKSGAPAIPPAGSRLARDHLDGGFRRKGVEAHERNLQWTNFPIRQ
jgi:DNA-binding Lrp family transcriptional regulator